MIFRVFYNDRDFFGNNEFFEQYAYCYGPETLKKFTAKCIKTLEQQNKHDFSFRVEREMDAEMLVVEQSWIDRENGVFRVTRVYGYQNNRDTDQIMDARALKAWIMRLYEKDVKARTDGAA